MKNTTCSIADCDKPAKQRGWCWAHYSRWHRHGDPLVASRPTPLKPASPNCTIAGCDKPHFAFGLCSAHYTRRRRHGHALGGRTSQGEPLDWLHAHQHHEGNECLIWPYARARGYGVVTIDGRQLVASNYMCELVNGPAPPGQEDAAHSCGKGGSGCVNPKHLRWASRVDNCNEKLVHGTMAIGEKSPMAKITERQVHEIREMKASGVHVDVIAEKYSMSRAGIYLIVNRTNWRWVA